LERGPASQVLGDGSHGYPRPLRTRISVDAHADRRKGDAASPKLIAQRKTGPIRAGEVLRLAAVTPTPDRTDGVQDPSCRQAVAGRFCGCSGRGSVGISAHQLLEE